MARTVPTLLAGLLAALCGSCERGGRSEGPAGTAPVPGDAAAPLIWRLASAERAGGLRYQAGPAPAFLPEEPLFADHFGGKVQRWVRVPDFDQPGADPAGTAAPADGVLTLAAGDGFLVAPVEVRAGQELELTLRARVPSPETRPQVVVCGVTRALPLRQELTRRSLLALWLEHRSLGFDAEGLGGAESGEPDQWTPLRTTFRTSFDTRAVWIVLSVEGDEGAVALDDLVLRPRPDRAAWAEAADGPAPFPPVPGVEHPFVRRLEVLEDLRDGFVLPPPAQVTAALELPPGDLVLEFASALWPEPRASHGARPLTLTLTAALEGEPARELWRRQWNAEQPPGFTDAVVELGDLAGRTVELTWAASTQDSADVVLIGAPLVRRRAPEDPRPTVILVSLDTLRADRLGAAGYPRPTTPHLDDLARRSVWFQQAQSTSAFTLPAHGSVMTGQMPSVHGLQTPGDFVPLSPERADLLAVRLQEAGYATAAFTGGGYVSPDFGFAQGFDRYDTADLLLSGEDTRWFRAPVADDPDFNRAFHASRGLDRALGWLDRHGDGPAFLFLHTYLVHNYRPSPEYRQQFHPDCDSDLGLSQAWLKRRVEDPSAIPPEDLRHYEELYDATLREADEAMGRLLRWLEETGRLEDSLLVVCSDHGEEFLDHASLGHGHALYQELVHVPLMVHAPGMVPREVTGPVTLADLMPTVLDYVGLEPRHPMQGQSLRAVLEGAAPPERRLLAELQHEGRAWAALRAGRFHYLRRDSAPAFEALYDLAEDPEEAYDLLQAADPGPAADLARRLRAELERHQQALRGLGQASRGGGGLTPEMIAELRALGYLDDGP